MVEPLELSEFIEELIKLEEQLGPVDEYGYVWVEGYGYPAIGEE